MHSGDKIILTVKDGAIYGGQYLDAERLVACVNACRGIPTHVLENWKGTDTAGLQPEDWLLSPVTEDGEGYLLASPAGGVMRLSSKQRERIGLALKALTEAAVSDNNSSV